MYKCVICTKEIDVLYHFIECVGCGETYHLPCIHTYKFKNESHCLVCNGKVFFTERYNYIEYLFYSIWNYFKR